VVVNLLFIIGCDVLSDGIRGQGEEVEEVLTLFYRLLSRGT
jgi:hypothetical protein